MEECPFCRIVAGEDSAHVLYESEHTVAFLDANPAVEGHTLIVPTAHLPELFAGNQKSSRAVFATVRRVARAVDQTLSPDGFSTFYTSGKLVGHVDHAHVHLLPRTANDDVVLSLSREPLNPEAGDRLTSRIRTAM